MPRDHNKFESDFSPAVDRGVILLAQLPGRGVDDDGAAVKPRGGASLAAPIIGFLLTPALVVGHANG